MKKVLESVARELEGDRPVRHRLPAGGRLFMDRPLPFLCLYRARPDGQDPGTRHLVTGEAAFLIAPADARHHPDTKRLVKALASALAGRFGAFLLLELWASSRPAGSAGPQVVPGFRIHCSPSSSLGPSLDALAQALGRVRLQKCPATVDILAARRWRPPGLPPVLSEKDLAGIPCERVGLEVDPVYRDRTGLPFPTLLRSLKRQVSRALKRSLFHFAVTHTTEIPTRYQALGQRIVAKSVSRIDEELERVSASFDLLLSTTPVNIEAAWQEFRDHDGQRMPAFRYRPLPVDPLVLKRRLFAIPTERIEEPTLARLFQEKQIWLDREITMLLDRNTPRFLPGSIQLYGKVPSPTFAAAEAILRDTTFPGSSPPEGPWLDAAAFARRARREVAYYRRRNPSFTTRVQVRNDLYAGLLVSRGNLLIGSGFRVSATRADTLLHHEIGTHALTYHNGRAQPFRQLASGLPGYDDLQEGLAVLAEYLSGGLTHARLRILAARVLSVQMLLDGASFVEVFRSLCQAHGFSAETAFTITTRVFRGGGFTKDALYLRGLVQVLEYLKRDGDLKTLFAGKIAAQHVKMIQELQARSVLIPPPTLPRYLKAPEAQKRMEALRRGLSVFDLLA